MKVEITITAHRNQVFVQPDEKRIKALRYELVRAFGLCPDTSHVHIKYDGELSV